MGRYIIDATDLPYAREFLDAPIGYHSPGLQRVLNHMRGASSDCKYVLVIEQRYSRWRLGKMPLRRGAAVAIVEDVHYSDLLEAERDIFKRRWRDMTGQDLDSVLAHVD
jgi:hypothetical protein